jgi:hypothetical protein
MSVKVGALVGKGGRVDRLGGWMGSAGPIYRLVVFLFFKLLIEVGIVSSL